MLKERKILLNSVFVSSFSFLSLILLTFPTISNAGPAQNLTLFGATLDNKIMPNCYLRKEYNYFMNQWTTNEICNPRILEVAPRNIPLNNSNAGIEGNIYLGPTTANVYNNVNTPFVNGNLGNNTFNYSGFYTGNNNRFSPNTWNGFGSASNYLLGSFGGGIGSNGYFNNYYPNSVFSYLPTSFSARLSWYDDYIPTYFLPTYYEETSVFSGNQFLSGSGYNSSYPDNLNTASVQTYGDNFSGGYPDNFVASPVQTYGDNFSDYTDNFNNSEYIDNVYPDNI